MKVKNIMFSGIMAAILGATAAQAADSAPVQLISKKYADRELQAKVVPGANIAIADDGKTISATGLVTQSSYDAKIGEIEQKLSGAATSGNLESLTTRVGDVEASLAENGETANKIAAALAAGQNAQSDVDAVEKSLTDNNTIEKANNAAVKTEVNAALALKADVSALNDYRTSADQDIIDNEIKGSITAITQDGGVIDTKVGALETTLDGRLDTLEQTATTYATKDEVNAKVAQSDYNTKVAELVQADTTNLTEAKSYAEEKATAAETAAKTYADGLNTAMDERVDVLEAIDHTKFAEKTTVEAIDGRLTTAEGEIDALQEATDTYATKQQITDAKYMSGVGQAAGQYVVNFDDQGNATYTAITIVE